MLAVYYNLHSLSEVFSIVNFQIIIGSVLFQMLYNFWIMTTDEVAYKTEVIIMMLRIIYILILFYLIRLVL